MEAGEAETEKQVLTRQETATSAFRCHWYGTFRGLRCPTAVFRLVFIFLLIVLLPLRGWTAERMAERMAATEVSTSQAMGAMPADCPMMMKMGSPHETLTDDSGTTTPTERTCQCCQLCMSLAAHNVHAVHSVCAAPQSVAVHRSDSFASADLPRVSKPPIA